MKTADKIHPDAKTFLNNLSWIPSRAYIKMVNNLCESGIFQKLSYFCGQKIEGE